MRLQIFSVVTSLATLFASLPQTRFAYATDELDLTAQARKSVPKILVVRSAKGTSDVDVFQIPAKVGVIDSQQKAEEVIQKYLTEENLVKNVTAPAQNELDKVTSQESWFLFLLPFLAFTAAFALTYHYQQQAYYQQPYYQPYYGPQAYYQPQPYYYNYNYYSYRGGYPAPLPY